MSILDRLASDEDEKNDLTTKERGFWDQWKFQFSWIRPILVHGFTRVKYIYYKRF